MKMPIPIQPTRPNPATDTALIRRAVHGKITNREPLKLAILMLFAASVGFVFALGALIHQLIR